MEDKKAVAADLKPIHQAVTIEEAETALDTFSQKWDELYPAISQIWLRHWEHIIPIFDYPMEISRIIYTTNAIKSLNRSFRKQKLFFRKKILFLSYCRRSHGRQGA